LEAYGVLLGMVWAHPVMMLVVVEEEVPTLKGIARKIIMMMVEVKMEDAIMAVTMPTETLVTILEMTLPPKGAPNQSKI